MKNSGHTMIESLLFFMIVILIIQYSCIMTHHLKHLGINQYDEKYEEAYK